MEESKPKIVGINHVALEVGNIDEAIVFLSKIFEFTIKTREKDSIFIDIGDQYLALLESKNEHTDTKRHFGLVVDDCNKICQLIKAAGGTYTEGPYIEFLDPWGNHFQVVEYSTVQFLKDKSVQKELNIELKKDPKNMGEW